MTENEREHTTRDELRNWLAPLRVDGPAGPVPPVCHLVVGFDRHPASRAALSYAMDLADRLNAFLHVAHIVDTDDLPIDPDSYDWEQRIADAVEQERQEACTMLSTLPGNWAYYSREGVPAQLLTTIAEANDALMIIVGTTRGGVMSLIERVLGESVSSTLARHALRPVLLVPATDKNHL
ncbi:MAG: universal stress protein [Rhodococcus sp. (in: high G+C Gram-positive bacteria)]|jgi:nucleotide-binding universal stress UspA family protein